MNSRFTASFWPVLLTNLFFVFILPSCDKNLIPDRGDETTKLFVHPEIGIEELLRNSEFTVTVSPRSHGYIARARGRGRILTGEYAGQNFQIILEGLYSGIGDSTLISGSALVRIRGEQFESVMDPLLQSFCCGEGHLKILGEEYVFWMFGQVNHSSADAPHNHLFAGLASTAGTMNMNIVDQSGSVVIPSDPPHDPGIGLIEGFDAQFVRVTPH